MDHVTRIHGQVCVLDRDDVDTDQIMPKQFLKRVERTGFGEFLFYDWAKEAGWDLPRHPILVTGKNFGCGSCASTRRGGWRTTASRRSSRQSFADIFYSNCTKIGLLPVVLTEEQCKAVAAAGEAEIDLADQVVRAGGAGVPASRSTRTSGTAC